MRSDFRRKCILLSSAAHLSNIEIIVGRFGLKANGAANAWAFNSLLRRHEHLRFQVTRLPGFFAPARLAGFRVRAHMIKSLSTFLSIGLLSLALTAGAQAQPAASGEDAVTTRSSAQTNDDEGFDIGLLGLLGLLGLAGLIPLKHRNPDHDRLQRRNLSPTETRK